MNKILQRFITIEILVSGTLTLGGYLAVLGYEKTGSFRYKDWIYYGKEAESLVYPFFILNSWFFTYFVISSFIKTVLWLKNNKGEFNNLTTQNGDKNQKKIIFHKSLKTLKIWGISSIILIFLVEKLIYRPGDTWLEILPLHPLSLLICLVFFAIAFAIIYVWNTRNYKNRKIVICISCEEPCKFEETNNGKCRKCGNETEDLTGFYKRHPEKQGGHEDSDPPEEYRVKKKIIQNY